MALQGSAAILQGSKPNLQATGNPQVQTTPATPAGSLKGTMTTPTAPVPAAPAAPTASVQAAGVQTATPAPGQLPSGGGASNPFALAQVMQSIQSKVTANNALMTQRNLLLKHLYNTPLTDAEKQQLDPTFLDAVNNNDRNVIDLKLRLIGDEIQGRRNTLDQSVQFLTNAYTQEQERLENQRQQAIQNVLSFANTYGSDAGAQLARLYGQGYVDQLKAQGIDIDAFAAGAAKTLAEGRESGSGGDATLAGRYLIDKDTDSGVRAILNNRKKYGDGGWGDVYRAIADKYGDKVADTYNGVLDNVFRLGTSVDAAFNNMKLTPAEPSGYVTDLSVRAYDAAGDLYNRATSSVLGRASAVQSKLPALLQTDDYRDFKADLSNLKSNIAFGALAQMREASKTGGALGAVSERELGLLEDSLAALDMSQTAENFRKNLQIIQDSIDRFNIAAGGQSLKGRSGTENKVYSLSEAKSAPIGAIINLDNGRRVRKVSDTEYEDL